MKIEKKDILIFGAGLAGIYTALNISKNRKITIVAKEKLGLSNSNLAQGGIAGELSDSEKILSAHIRDTLIAGVGLHSQEAVSELVRQAKDNLEYLIELGVPFDVDSSGNILLTKEAGHSTRRILHAGGDATGQKVMETLIDIAVKQDNIEIIEEAMLIDLIVKNGKCYGGKTINKNNEVVYYMANHTILATGGLGAVYKDSTNARGASGDGVAAAYRSGVEIANMEFVQFHPTVFYDVKNEIKGQKFLISEAVRGEGAYLLNIEKDRFMSKYDERLELAPRDIVARAITHEMYDTWSEYVYIDARHLGKEFLEKRFPTIYSKCLENNLQMENDLIPVAPVEHYAIGGVKIDINGRTNVDYLYANGECCNSGVHGANRLASNSLLECLVFGKRIANLINESKVILEFPEIEENAEKKNNFSYHDVREQVRNAMNDYVFIVRTTEGLNIANKIINKHYKSLIKYPYMTMDYYRALNTVTVAKIITEAALNRKESIGCHYRID